MKFKLKFAFIVILVVSLFVFTACSQNEKKVSDQSKENIESSNPKQEGEENEESDSNEEVENEKLNGEEPGGAKLSDEEIIIDSGTYVGMIDNNHIEINISGVLLEIAGKVFIVNEEIKNTIEKEITKEDQVKFEYYLGEDDVCVIINIEKIVN